MSERDTDPVLLSAPPQSAVRAMSRLVAKVRSLSPQAHLPYLGPQIFDQRIAFGQPALQGQGEYNLRGTARIFALDGSWAVLNLARPSDNVLLPAWTCEAVPETGEGLGDWLRGQRFEDVAPTAWDLGLAFALVSRASPGVSGRPWRFTPSGVPLSGTGGVNLAGLWAGPLAGRILHDTGCPMRRMMTTGRAASSQPAWAVAFDAWLHSGQPLSNVSALTDEVARYEIDKARVIITGSRIAGLQRAGITPRPDQLWIRITAYGSGTQAHRIGYGDDVGLAAGGAKWDNDIPYFQGDAFVDPLTGVVAALAAREALIQEKGGIIDVSLFGVAAWTLRGGEL